MSALTGIQKTLIAVVAVALAGGGYFFYSSRAATEIALTLTTNPDLERGLVGHWTFDGPDVDWGTSSGQVKDRSPSLRHGTATSSMSSVISSIAGPTGQAIEFRGPTGIPSVGDSILVGDYAEYDITGALTISAWVRSDSENNGTYVSKYCNGCAVTDSAYRLQVDNVCGAGYTGHSIVIGNGVGSNMRSSEGDGAPYCARVGEWHHVVGIFKPSEALEFYGNGELIARRTDVVYSSIPNTDYPLRLGVRDDPLGVVTEFWDGALDDVRIYNRALSAEEVKRLYGLGATTKVAQTITTNPDLERGLVGHWTFDGPDVDWSSTTAEVKDRSGNNNHGNALAGVSSASVRGGVLGQAMSFNGTSNYITLGNPASLDITDAITVAAWFKASNTANWDAIVARGHGAASDNTWQLSISSAGLINTRIYTNSGGQSPNLNGPTPIWNTWQFGAFTYDGSFLRLYVDGVEVGTPVSVSGNLVNDANFIGIGAESANGSPSDYFNGSIDDVRVYNRALSADEVKRLYDLGR